MISDAVRVKIPSSLQTNPAQNAHVNAPLKYCNKHLNDSTKIWEHIFLLIKAKIAFLAEQHYIQGEKEHSFYFNPRITIPILKHSQGKIMVWG